MPKLASDGSVKPTRRSNGVKDDAETGSRRDGEENTGPILRERLIRVLLLQETFEVKFAI